MTQNRTNRSLLALWKDSRVGIRAAIIGGVFLIIVTCITGVFGIINVLIDKPDVVVQLIPIDSAIEPTTSPIPAVNTEPTSTPVVQNSSTSVSGPVSIDIDIVLVLDGSRSMNDLGFMTDVVRPAIQGFLEEIVTGRDKTQISVLNFSDDRELIWPLSGTDQININAIMDRVWAGGGDQIDKALSLANDEFVKNGRSGATKEIIILSDGILKSPYRSDTEVAIQIANSIKAEGIKIYVIAAPINTISPDDLHFLQTISSGDSFIIEALTTTEIKNSLITMIDSKRLYQKTLQE